MSSQPLLSVRDLQTQFISDGRVVKAVDGVSFDVRPGEILGIVGESGSGKSVTALSVMGLIPWPPGRVVGGSILFDGEDLRAKTQAQMRRVRGAGIAMVFQEPRTAMNPVFRIGEQMTEVIMLHRKMSRAEALGEARSMLDRVHIAEPERVIRAYPYELSGGMLQRAMIAMELALRPRLLIADEPTTALDVTIQAQILRLIRELHDEFNLTVLFITHDLGVIAQLCDRVMVMYAGAVVELSPVEALFHSPAHPYTRKLLAAVPSVVETRGALKSIAGDVPDLANLPPGCRFYDRCDVRQPECRAAFPDLRNAGEDHLARCVLVEAGSP